MVYTDIDIANLGLTMLGNEPITSFNDGTYAATLAQLWINNSKAFVLQSWDWPEAHGRRILALTTTVPEFTYEYAFQLPSDYLLFISASTDDFIIEGNKFLTNTNYVELKYIKNPTDVSEINPLLAQAIGAQLAVNIALALTGQIDKKTALEQSLLNIISTAGVAARNSDANRDGYDDIYSGVRLTGRHTSIPRSG